MKVKILLSLVATFFSIALAELLARAFLPTEHDHAMSVYSFSNYPTLQEANSTIHMKRTILNSSKIFDSHYNFDSFGRRKVPVKENASEGHIFFGGSFIFGDWLEDNETFPWLVSEKSSFQVYSYAQGGYGPNNMLAILKEHNIDKQTSDQIKKFDVSFFSYLFHTERYLGKLRWVGRVRVNEPYFDLSNLDRENFENFATAKPLRTFTYWLLYHLKLGRIIAKTWHYDSGETSQKLLCAIVNRSFFELKNQLKGRLNQFNFVISPFLIHPQNHAYYQGVRQCLNSDINVLDFPPPEDFIENQDKYLIDPPLETHPSRFANEWFAEKFLHSL